MSGHHWPELYVGPWIVTGNVAKAKVLHDLHHIPSSEATRAILDIGCTSPSPLEVWEPLLGSHVTRFHLTGIDLRGVEEAQIVVEQRGWKNS